MKKGDEAQFGEWDRAEIGWPLANLREHSFFVSLALSSGCLRGERVIKEGNDGYYEGRSQA